jgi:ribosomal protein S18 acetylase RimI-like enzyme
MSVDQPELVARATQLNEQELWREMVRWSGGVVHEEDGLLFVAGPSRYLRAAMRLDADVDAAESADRAAAYFDSEHIFLVSTPQDADVVDAALERGYRPEWTELAMVLSTPPHEPTLPAGVELRPVIDERGVSDYGHVVAAANDDPGERERAPLLFHGKVLVAPHLAAFVAYAGDEPVSCAMTLVSHGVCGVFYVATVESARRRGLGEALTRIATRAGYGLGAKAAWLGASAMGADLYRRIGFEDLGTSVVEYESPHRT